MKLDLEKTGRFESAIRNALDCAGIPHNKNAIRKTIQGKWLHPPSEHSWGGKPVDLLRYRNYGIAAHKALCALVGVEPPQVKAYKLQITCPYCRGVFDLKGNNRYLKIYDE